MHVHIAAADSLFTNRRRLARGTVGRGPGVVQAFTTVPDGGTDAELIEAARPLLVAEFAAGRWRDPVDPSVVITVDVNTGRCVLLAGTEWKPCPPRQPIDVSRLFPGGTS